MDTEPSSDALPKQLQQLLQARHPREVINRPPTPQDLLELSARVYRSSRKPYAEADSQGMRVYHDELIMGDVRMVMLVPSWFPKAHVAFDWDRLQGDTVSVVLVLRGTMQVVQAWLLELLLRHPVLDARAAPDAAAAAAAAVNPQQQQHGWPHQQHAGGYMFGALPGMTAQQQQQQQQQLLQKLKRQLKLDIHITGHSLGGLLAEVATVESAPFAAAHGAAWHCTSFEGPGLPELYHTAALRAAPREHWNDVITSYLAAPNPINMLYEHLGSVVHVVVPWEQTWSHVAKCVGADVARVTAWAIVGGMLIAGAQQLTGGIMGVLECLAGVLGVEVEELIAQHALGPMRQCFDPHTGQLKARYRRDMACWPSLGHRRKVLLAAAQQVAKWSLPSFVCRDNVGVANIGSRTAMVEARCSRLEGYAVMQQPGDEDAAAAAGDAGAVLDDSRSSSVLEDLLDAEEGLLLNPEQQQQQQLAAAAAASQHLLQRGQLHRKMLRPPHQQQQQQLEAAATEHLQEQQMQEQLEAVMVEGYGTSAAAAAGSCAAAAAGPSGFRAGGVQQAGVVLGGRQQGLGFAPSAMDVDEEEAAAAGARKGGRGGAMQLAFGGH
ncbi:hypothetical protein OEZ86_004644 [Tetradesmus obliquus]|nr:hypothetical protein OEZ86_004644 [Tetradesmus obliquus]